MPWLKFAAIAAGKGISMAVACPSICVYPPPNAVLPSGSVRSVLAPCWLCPGRPRGHPAAPFYFHPPLPHFPLLLPSPGGSQSVDVFLVTISIRWEHDPAWAITSKLLISKHQQVQLLEAASVLVNMNHDGPEAESELSSASPDASSERHEGLSSAHTTPPPMEQMNSVDEEDDMDEEENDDEDDMEMSDTGDKLFTAPNNNSNNPSGLYSRSYQTGPSSSFTGSAPLHSPSFSNYQRHSSIDTRPSTADTKLHDDDEADLAAAIGLCNFGTPRTRPVALSPSIPPVPPLPSRFLDPNGGSNAGQQSQSLDQSKVSAAETAFPGSVPNMFLSLSYNPSLSYKVSDEREVRRGDADRTSRQNRNADVDFGSRPAPADDDDDGVFGRMEE